LERFGEKSSQNIIQSILKSKEVNINKFLFSLGIPNIGKESAQIIANRLLTEGEIKNPNELLRLARKLQKQDYNDLPDFGDKMTESIYEYFYSEHTQQLFDKLTKSNVKILTNKRIVNQKLKGLKFLFTGELKSMSRPIAQEKVKERGGEIKETVTKDLNYLVVGENPGSKVEKAKKLEVRIIGEKEFMELIKE